MRRSLRILLLFLCAFTARPVAAQSVVINELDADTPGTDEAEFVELYNTGASAVDLSDYVLVFFNGNGDASYQAFDLDGYTIEPGGFFLLGNEGVPGTSITFPPNTLQNGADAVGLYTGSAADFPNGTAVTSTNLVDAFVYGTSDADDTELLAALGQSVQYDEAAGGDKDHESIQRVPDGSDNIVVAAPTPMGVGAGEAQLSFTGAELSGVEGAVAYISVTLSEAVSAQVSADVTFAADSLNAEAADLGGFTTQHITFPAGSTDPQTVSFTITDDTEMEGVEEALLRIENVQGAAVGNGSLVLLIEPSDVPLAHQAVLFAGVTGEALADSLRAHYTPDRTLGYDVARDTLYVRVEARDSFVVDVYTGKLGKLMPGSDPSALLSAQGINAEHVFPQSMGVSVEPLRSDMHNLFPADADANSLRGNNPYAELPDASVSDWLYRGSRYQSPLPSTDEALYSEYLSNQFEPKESFKGNAARALMYMATIYEGQATGAFFDQQKDLVLAWNRQAPADSLDRARSALIAMYQGNENPFVLDSTLASRIWGGAGSVAAEPAYDLPSAFVLEGNYPNPFNPSTTVRFDLPAAARVVLTVYDLMGREVLRVNGGDQAAGAGHELHVDATGLATGLYVYRLSAEMAGGLKQATGRMLFVK